MKWVYFISAVIIAVIMAGLLATNVKKKNTDITREKTKVAMIMNGSIDDHSWGQSHYEGMQKTAKDLNLEVWFRQNIPADKSSEDVMEGLIGAGVKIIVVNSFQFGPYIQNVAAQHPDVKFFHASGVKSAPNVSTFFGRIYQMRYLSGLVAGKQSKTGNVGYVAAFDIPEVVRGINAFTLGVKKANPDANVIVRWTKSWEDDSSCAYATRALLAKNDIDVLAMHTDSREPMRIADSLGIWVVGYNLDNAEFYPDHFLTAPVWRWEKFYTPHILEVLKKKFVGQSYWDGFSSGIVDLSPFTSHVNPEAVALVAIEREKIQKGSFDVFYGPIEDNAGTVRVNEGESMSDSDMLNHFNWFVKGVKIDEE
ncbi:MAG: BMP family ABC transporter substrate-binding protein [Fibrobacter sp.]|nr:BMP family ABC transporter substrate-binding protein [Fibrobacter sp.]